MRNFFIILLISFSLIGCVSEKDDTTTDDTGQENGNGDGNGDGDGDGDNNKADSILIQVPKNESNEEISPTSTDKKDNLSFVFINKNKNNCENEVSDESYVYSFSNFDSSFNIESAKLEIKYNYENKEDPSKDLKTYIKNLTYVEESLSSFNDVILSDDCSKFSFNFDFDDLPASFISDIEKIKEMDSESDLENGYIIENAITLSLILDSPELEEPVKKDININIKNSNNSPKTEKIDSITKTIKESSQSLIFEDIYDENFNDSVVFKLTNLPEDYKDYLRFSFNENHELLDKSIEEPTLNSWRKLYKTDSQNNNKELENKINIGLNTSEVTSIEDKELNFSIIVSDLRIQNYSEENEENIYYEKEIPVTIFIENFEEDLYPKLNVQGTKTISEANGGKIDFSVNNSVDNPSAELNVDYVLEFSNATYTENLFYDPLAKSGYIEFSDINISGDQEGLLILTVDDGVNTTTKEIVVTFKEDLDRNPTLTINESDTVNISEENGGSISFTAKNNNPESEELVITYDIALPNEEIITTLNSQSLSFTNISIKNDYNTTLTITASDGVSTVSDSINVVFVDDIDSEFLEFKAEYQNKKLKYSQIKRDDELVVLSFVKEFSRIQYVKDSIINDYDTQVNQFLSENKVTIDNLIDKIDIFISKEDSYTKQEFETAKSNLNELEIQVSNYGLEALDVINDLISETNILPTLITSKNEVNGEGYYSRYVGNTSYGNYLDQEERIWQFNDAYKFLELVNIQNGQCK